jgi:hypothetical protein
MIDLSDDDKERIEVSIRDRAFKDGGFATAYAILALKDEAQMIGDVLRMVLAAIRAIADQVPRRLEED